MVGQCQASGSPRRGGHQGRPRRDQPDLDVTQWHGFDMNPKSVNPASGFVCTANNAPASNDSIAIPGHYYAGNTRAGAIMKALSAPKNDWTLPEAQAIQLDHHSPVYESNARMLADLRRASGRQYEVLQGWDGSHLAEDVAPTVYYLDVPHHPGCHVR